MSVEITEKTIEFQMKFNIFNFDIAKQIIEYFETKVKESSDEGLEEGRSETL